MTRWLPLVAALALLAPAHAKDERASQPPRVAPRAPALIDLGAEVERWVRLVQDPARFHAGNAAAALRQGYAGLFALDPAKVDAAKVDAAPAALARRVFDLMLALDDRCAGFDAQGRLTTDIVEAKRRAMRGARHLREAILQRTALRAPEALHEGARPALARRWPRQHWTVRPGMGALTPDRFPRTFVVLCAGKTVVSAAIARSASEDNMFSHFALAHRADTARTVEGKTYPAGTLFIIEALIEKGVTIHPLDDHYAGGSVRDVIFFLRDPSRQQALDAAAAAFFERARAAIARGRPLGYDFTMSSTLGLTGVVAGGTGRSGDPVDYFCSGVGEDVFRRAGIDLFAHRTLLRQGPGTRELFRSWGVDVDQRVPAPGDADVSPSLVRVAEGCVIADLKRSHMFQAVLGRVFTWMDRPDGYALRAPWWYRAGATVAGTLNDSPFDVGLVPHNMTPGILKTFLPLKKTGEAYLAALEAENARFEAARGRPMTPLEMQRWLDANRDRLAPSRWYRRR